MPRLRHYKTLRYYETAFALKPTLTEEETKKKLQEVKEFIKKKGGELLYEEDWGLKKLAYPVQNFNNARYFILQFKTENPQQRA